MAGSSTDALASGASQALTLTGTWTSYSASYTCSDTADPAASAWLQGSADGGATWFPLTPYDSAPPAATGTGVRFYKVRPVNAVQAFVTCGPGNTVTVTVTGN